MKYEKYLITKFKRFKMDYEYNNYFICLNLKKELHFLLIFNITFIVY